MKRAALTVVAVVILAALAALGVGPTRAEAGAASLQATPTLAPTPEFHIDPGVLFPAPQPQPMVAELSPAPDLVVATFQTDRVGYLPGMSASLTIEVRNLGTADAASTLVNVSMCVVQAGSPDLVCGSPLSAGGVPALAPGGSSTLSPSFDFTSVPTDPALTGGMVPGIPDHADIYLRAWVQPPSSGTAEANTMNNNQWVVTDYPTGNPAVPYNQSEDEDLDGWMAQTGNPVDCGPSLPSVHPFGVEIAGNGWDDDCAGGDAPTPPPEPASAMDWENIDLDGDGYSEAEGDCDDLHGTAHPGAPEIDDGVDNNCDRVIDEGFAVPDWVIGGLRLDRDHAPHVFAGESALGIINAGVSYFVLVDNLGEDMGTWVDHEVAQSAEIRDILGNLFATGESGLILYGSLPAPGYAATIECSPSGFIAVLPGGILGEVNSSNNWAIGLLPDVGGPDLDFSAQTPGVSYDRSHRMLRVVGGFGVDGDCPEGKFHWNALLFHATTARRRVVVEGQQVYESAIGAVGLVAQELGGYDPGYGVPAGVLWFPDLYASNIPLSDQLRSGDIVEVETWVNVPAVMAESPSNNYSRAVFEYHNPLIGEEYFELIESVTGHALEGTELGQTGSALTGTSTSSLAGALIAGGALFLGIAGAGFAGYGARALGLGRSLVALAAVGGAVGGAAIGYGAGSGLLARPIVPEPLGGGPFPTETPSPPFALLDDDTQIISCDRYLDPRSAIPLHGARLIPEGRPIMLDLSPTSGSSSEDMTYALQAIGPDGHSIEIEWPAVSGDPSPFALDLSTQPGWEGLGGTFAWGVRAGYAGDALRTSPAVCQGSTYRSFTLGSGPAEEPPTDTPTPTSIVTGPVVPPTIVTRTPTHTPTSAPAPDTTGPMISGVAHSPSPIYESDPKGCDPRVTIVTASLSDPSGVASAQVLVYHTAFTSVPMSQLSGGTWRAGLGPFPDVGDGTIEYQVRAYDGLGNLSDSAFQSFTILACIP